MEADRGGQAHAPYDQPLALTPLALTMGDPAGIGPEITLRAWSSRSAHQLAPFVVYGDPHMLEHRARALGLKVPISCVAPFDGISALFPNALPVYPVALAAPVVAGQPDSANAPAVIMAIEQAVTDTASGKARAVVTNPIAKSVLYGAGFAHPGHTEFLSALAVKHWPGQRHRPVMMLASESLRVVPLTIHVPLKDVPPLITRALIAETVRITSAALTRDFGIETPRIAICGLNPHAGEGGALGREETETIAPAIRDLQRAGFAVSGPHSADSLFHEAARRTYDCVIAMYHDQALIPLKTLAFDRGVNITLGLPFVRTSPDHGTAFDIAAEGRASSQSLINALKVADQISVRRAAAPQ
jgi:4-hydroxythreonine-4-phosphate dehydrogenase